MRYRGVTRRTFLKAGAGAGALFIASPRIWGANNRVAVAVAGLGRDGQAHLAAWSSIPHVEVVGVCDIKAALRDHCLAQLVGQGRPRPRSVSDVRWLLDDSDVDAISIALPQDLQGAVGIAACEAGKDVLVTPPAVLTEEEGDTLLRVAARNRRLVDCLGRPAWSPATPPPAVREALFGLPTEARASHVFAMRGAEDGPATGPKSGARRPPPKPDDRAMWWSAGLLDLLQRDQSLGAPTLARSLTTGGLGSNGDAVRCRFNFEPGSPFVLELDARAIPRIAGHISSRDPLMQVSFRRAHQRWTALVLAEPVVEPETPWRRFASAARTRDASQLNWPLEEALRTVRWIRAARGSARHVYEPG